MAFTSRYSTLDKAIIVTTGNTLVICGDENTISNNTSDMLMPNGNTTRDYSLAGSSAKINILKNSKILYAELVWLSTVKSKAAGALDVQSVQDDPITFKTPMGTQTVSPDFNNSYTSAYGNIDRIRAKDVTNIIKNSLSGTYTVMNVPTSIPASGLSEVRSGWALIVIYRNDLFKPKRIVYALGIEGATVDTPIQAAFTGFSTENDESTLKGDFVLVMANGNPLDGTDILKLGSSFAQLKTVGNSVGTPNLNPGTSPNNPWNSFSSGQINIADTLSSNRGLIDITGTNGTVNHDAFLPTQVKGARNKWDITAVDISSTLTVNQTQLAGQYTISNKPDSLEVVAFATQVNSIAPDIVATLSSYDSDGDDQYNIKVDESVTYVVKISNSGRSSAKDIFLSTTLNPALSFIANSVTINGVIQKGADITKGIDVGSLEPTGVTNIGFTVKAVSLVDGGGTADTVVSYNYSFTSGPSSPTYTNYADTNTLSLIVQDGKLNVEKRVSASSVKLGDTLIYTTQITNIGSETSINMSFQDIINKYCSFVPKSVTIDDIAYENYDPNVGFSLANLSPNSKTIIKFSVKVDSLSPNTVVENGALVTFSYIFNQYIVPITKTVSSNITSIQIEYVDIIGTRNADNYYPSVGDIVTYTLKVSNIGNSNASNVKVIEPPIPGTSFVDGSVYIDGERKLVYDPFKGFTIEAINAKTTSTIIYQVKVIELVDNQIVKNIAQVPFKYQIIPGGEVISTEIDSNKVITKTNFVTMNITETVDKDYAVVGDILYYSVDITNTGNIDAINTNFLSAIQSETTFVPNSVAINGIIQKGLSPDSGFSLGNIAPSNTITITYQATVNKIPEPNIIYNNSSLIYSYKPDPNGVALTNSITGNTVKTIINKGSVLITKTVDKAYGMIGDYLIYKTVISNTGTVNLTNVSFSDELATYIEFLAGSFYIGGINLPEYNPRNSLSIDTITPNESIEIVFGAKIVNAPTFGYVYNQSDLTYSYKLSPNSPNVSETRRSNNVETKVVNGQLLLTKTASLSYATINDVIKYSFEVSNVGNVSVNNVFFYDNIPAGATFVESSVVVNGISKEEYNPIKGFNIGTLNVGQVVSISFNIQVVSVPVPNSLINKGSANYEFYIDTNMPVINKTSNSNNVTTIINYSSIELNKTVDKQYATINDVLTYTINVHNTGSVILSNVVFSDLIPSEASFIPKSVMINNDNYPDYNPNNSFNMPDILPDGNSTISFNATIVSLPTTGEIDNSSKINYSYKLSPTGASFLNTKKSNTVVTYVNMSQVTNNKSVDKEYAQVKDSLTYTCLIKNSGTTDITDTKFIDILASEISFTKGSVTINSKGYSDYDPNLGFTLGTIKPKETVTVAFNVSVDSLPLSGFVNNYSTIYYKYRINPSGPDISSSQQSNTATIYIKSGTLTITKASNREYAKTNDIIKYSFTVANTGNTTLNNLFFKDNIQQESSFNLGTVYINGMQKSNYNPNTGFYLDDLPLGQYATIEFEVTVNSLPADGKLYNTGNVSYLYYIDPTKDPIVSNITSNKTIVNINDAIITTNKTVDKTIAKLGETLNYSISIYNAGNVSATSVNFIDLLDSNISFNTGTVIINERPYTEYNPNGGFSLGDIAAKSTVIVSFAATIKTRPEDNIVENHANISYSYRVNPSDPYIDVSTKTNMTTTYVAYAELTLTKNVDKLYETIGGILNYTINIKNTGSVTATNIVFNDKCVGDATFIPNTVYVDGEFRRESNPNSGFALSDLSINESHTVSFNVKINYLPSSGKIENTANTTFKYQLTPKDPIESNTSFSNLVFTYINLGKLELTKSVNQNYATILDTLTYTITIENDGNVECSNIFFKDIIQAEGSFVSGTVKINKNPQLAYNPNTGFKLENIKKDGTTTITFDVTVNTLPSNYKMNNNAIVNYEFIVDPAKQAVSSSSTSNTVTTNINVGKLTVTKVSDKYYATIDDIVAYTVTVVNNGNISADLVNFRDVIPSGLTFVTDSVIINGENKPGLNPYQSFTLGSISAGSSTVIKFNVKITSLPIPSLVTNIADVVFSYKIDPKGEYKVVEVYSNPVNTQINLGMLTINKAVDYDYCTIGNILTYTLQISNTGNINAKDVIFKDGIQEDASFVDDSVIINSDKKAGYDPRVGFNIGKIEPLGKVTVIFKVKVNSLPSEYSISNIGIATFSYNIIPTGETYTKSIKSNSVATKVVVAGLNAIKSTNMNYATINDEINYMISIKNTGNTTNASLFFKDFLQNEANFKTGSVILNDVPDLTLDPRTGFYIPDLGPGHIETVSFIGIVNSLPEPPQITNYASIDGNYKIDPKGTDYKVATTSNTVETQINVGDLTVTKSVDTIYAKVGDIITYYNLIKNVGNVKALNTIFFDNFQTELQFVSGTVSINDVIYPKYDPTVGFEIGDIINGGIVKISFDAKIISLPASQQVLNNSQTKFEYRINPEDNAITKTVLSNTVTTNVIKGEITASKIVDKSIATMEDILVYTVALINKGNAIAKEVFFQDTPSTGATFKSGTVTINGKPALSFDPTLGFNIGDLGIGNIATIQFVATVTSVPETNKVTNQAVINFKYLVNPTEQPILETTYSNITTTNIAIGNLTVTKAVNKAFATIGEKLTYTVVITNTGNINATNVVFLDPTPANSIYVLGSVIVNGESKKDYNPSIGFDLDTMKPGQIITVSYQIQVI